MVRLDIQIIRHPHRFACRIVENSKRKPGTPSLARESLVNEIAQFIGCRNRCVPELPKLAVLQGFEKIIRMAMIERCEACSRAL